MQKKCVYLTLTLKLALYIIYFAHFFAKINLSIPPPKKNKNKVVIGNKILWYITNNGLLRGLHRTHDSSSQ